MISIAEEMTSIRDANSILIHIVCDTDLEIQGFEILERVQKKLLRRQMCLLLRLRFRAKCIGNIRPKGIHP